MTTTVSEYPAASPEVAAAHFAARLSLETDPADVHSVLEAGNADFVLLDTRSAAGYAKGHVPGALSLPHRAISAERMAEWADDTLFVVYCFGPHCNAADQGALKLARLGRKVKVMIGGLWGWVDEGYSVAHGVDPGSLKPAGS
ncbi:rhodanese-like domain-containing protein [Allosphingosinicella flava]|uniref:Rhodanese-like domain-containing protein n=1 Tax=Allosphingosinicella flava TaxID=2771430 RepID=A0A7T2GJ36_9SPHN|nr:rhodanese-like domain-containing protein [Sphingosinicella flava]QPQ54808.1 rhodanese-like domain-containing protein [Sphingosinicella flava]